MQSALEPPMHEPAKLRVTIASVPDRDEVVGEIWCETSQVAEVRNEAGVTRITLFPAQSGTWDFELGAFLESIAKAAQR